MNAESVPALDVETALARAAHVLPAQGPISVFIHHNTLHAFQHLPFHDAIAAASRTLGIGGYPSEASFRDLLRERRITTGDVARVEARFRTRIEALASELDVPSRSAGGPKMLLSAADTAGLVVRHGLERHDAESLRFARAELGVTRRLASDVPAAARANFFAELQAGGNVTADGEAEAVEALYAECCRVELRRPRIKRGPARPLLPRDLFVRARLADPAELVGPVMVRLSAAYLDAGLARSAWPGREDGFLYAWRRLVLETPAVLPEWQQELVARVRQGASLTAAQLVERALDELGTTPQDREPVLGAVLLQLPGWAGMFHRLEHHPDDRPRNAPPASLLEMTAVRLTYDLCAWRWLARTALGHTGPLSTLSEQLERRRGGAAPPAEEHEAAWPLFRLCQLAGISALTLSAHGARAREATVELALRVERDLLQPILLEAYEDHYYDRVLAAITAARARARSAETRPVGAQVVVCIDDREESFRRAIEEVAPSWETFGAAGFFGLPIGFQGLDDSATAALCPVVQQPAAHFAEEPVDDDATHHERRLRARNLVGRIEAAFLHGSRSLTMGTLLTPTVGLFAAVPFALRILFPGLAGRLRSSARRNLLPQPRTQLTSLAERGLSDEAKIARMAATLRGTGLSRRFARLVVVLGHGSVSLNNPHRSAYDCGACGGRHGGPNARLFAELANSAVVRQGLRALGIDIPDMTVFIGGQHNTATDGVELFDADRVPESHAPDLLRARSVLEQARRLSAHERCRRFESAPRDPTLDAALAHVEDRTEDLSQARPELGHVTNATCIVGRRVLTRDVFLDRRAFLVSYDPGLDTRGQILERTLEAVGPVGAGINLEYYFSSVEPDRLGSGTKLPHNVSALLGVMEGSESDLRTGLPRQMIEIHEPVRLLVLCEATPATLLEIAGRNAIIRELVVNEWVRLASIDPETGSIAVWRGAAFEPWALPRRPVPIAKRSRDWYVGKTGFVEPALLTPARLRRAPAAAPTPEEGRAHA